MKFVYVLISDGMDYYCEQAMASFFSLRKNNHDAEIVVLVDKDTMQSIQCRHAVVMDMADDIKVVDVSDHYDNMQRSRFIKTSLTTHVEGDFVFLDIDTLILRPFPDMKSLGIQNIGAVLHAHGNSTKSIGRWKDYLNKTGKKGWDCKAYYNSGVMLVRNTDVSVKFFDEWHSLWKYETEKFGIRIDQPSMSQAEINNPGTFVEIDGSFNCQPEGIMSKRYMFNPTVFHYFAKINEKHHFPLRKPSVLKHIRTAGIDDGILKIIDNPQLYYFNNWKVLSGKDSKFFDSLLCRLSRKIYFMFGS